MSNGEALRAFFRAFKVWLGLGPHSVSESRRLREQIQEEMRHEKPEGQA